MRLRLSVVRPVMDHLDLREDLGRRNRLLGSELGGDPEDGHAAFTRNAKDVGSAKGWRGGGQEGSDGERRDQ